MDEQDIEKELSENVCVSCGRKLLKGEGHFIKPDGVCCVDCHKKMKLEPHFEDLRAEG